MQRRYGALIALLVLVSACSNASGGQPSGSPPSATLKPVPVTHIPVWCGGAAIGPAPPPGSTPGPVVTPDPHTLLCIYMVNRSSVDMASVDPTSWGLIAACSSASSSGPVPAAPWGFEIYRAVPGSVTGPVLGAFSSTEVSGEPPYLIEVSIGPDQGVSIRQQGSLPDFVGAPPGLCGP